MSMLRRISCLCMGLLLGISACAGEQVPGPMDDLPSTEGLKSDTVRLPGPLIKGPVRLGLNEEVALRHLLISYAGAFKPPRKMRLDREQARQRATHLLALAQAEGQDFAELCKRYSDDSKTSPAGGQLGVVMPGELHPALERLGFSLKLGQVGGPVETPFGFHLVERVEPEDTQTAEIVVSYTGAARHKPRISRSREEAQVLADEVHKKLIAGADFAALARAHSDLATYERGGFLPTFRRGMAHPKFEEIVWNLPVGGLSKVIETKTGFHIVFRLPVRRISVRTIEIFVQRLEAGQEHSREEALEIIQEIRRQSLAKGADFARLAMLKSEGGNKLSGGGGLMRPFGRGQINFIMEQAAFALAPGQISEVIALEKSFLLLKRIQ